MVGQAIEAEEEGDEDDDGEGQPMDWVFTIYDTCTARRRTCFGFTIRVCDLTSSLIV
jgi:hypothetical protein